VMKLSPNLARQTWERYQEWRLPSTPQNARQALYTFNGDAYQGLDAYTLESKDVPYAQEHLRILSALYGIIRPLDLIQPYRIEMGMKFSFAQYANLYAFWEKRISDMLLEDIKNQGDNVLVNLASQEYFSVVEKRLKGIQLLTPVFKEQKGDQLKVVSQKAKRARGLMSRFIIQNQLEKPEELKLFDTEGYFYNDRLSDDNTFVFTR
jgi:cytoplasmic iron level regulating protein YaaA (DUF328/UPF0246 family)